VARPGSDDSAFADVVERALAIIDEATAAWEHTPHHGFRVADECTRADGPAASHDESEGGETSK
jgi:hypothetical protein